MAPKPEVPPGTQIEMVRHLVTPKTKTKKKEQNKR